MSNIIETEDRIVEFLISDLDEPARTSGNPVVRQTTATQSFVATPSQSIFTITDNPAKNVFCINTVVQQSTTLTKYVNYDIDLKNKKVTLLTAASSNDSIDISYKYGTNTWIYADKPRVDLSSTAFPRIGVTKISSSGDHLGSSTTDLYEVHRFQVDIQNAKDVGLVFSGENKYNNEAVKAMKRLVENSIEVNYNDTNSTDLFYILPISKNPSPFDEPNNKFRYIMEYEFRYFNEHS